LKNIEVDLDVYKALTLLLETEETTYNDVLRALLKLPGMVELPAEAANSAMSGWMSKNVMFPNGTIFRATFKGNDYQAEIENDSLIYDGNAYNSLSEAAIAVTKSQRNGWTFWECKLPHQTRWKECVSLRKK
jgi:hypothetical protein